MILIVLSAALPAGRRGYAALIDGRALARTIPWWMLAGGAAGALTVATQGLAVAIIGVSLFTVGVVAGQALCGLVLDRVGLRSRGRGRGHGAATDRRGAGPGRGRASRSPATD